MNAIDHKCPSCSASLPYNPTTGHWNCEYCGIEYTIDELNKIEDNQEKNNHKKIDVDEYTCPNCGAHIVTDENTTATFCIYCGSTSIIKGRLEGLLKPKAIIPFKTTKEQAIEAFKKSKKGRLFAPKDFAKKEQIDKITGVYIPFWLYDCNCNGNIDCTATKVTSWRAGDYRYTKTDTYNVERSGTAVFENVPVDGSIKFDDDVMDSIEPFDYSEFTDFSMSYLSGFLSEKYDVDSETAYNRAFERIKSTFSDELKNDISGYGTVSINNSNINLINKYVEYVLLPVWMLNIKYNNKMHLFAMNGQTGKMVGNIPIAVAKAFLWAAGVFLGTLAISLLFL